MIWFLKLRLTLLISLSILFIVLLYRRFKERVVARDLPARQHAELIALEVMYHPARLRVEVIVPNEQELFPAMLTPAHAALHAWPSGFFSKGRHVMELSLNGYGEGEYFFELGTSSQRTVRKFNVRQG